MTSYKKTKIDIGLKIMESLKLKNEALSHSVIMAYTEGGKPELVTLLKNNIDLLEKCTLPIPRDIIARVCRCSTESIRQLSEKSLIRLRKLSMEFIKNQNK